MTDYERRMQNWSRWRRGGAAALVKRNSPLAYTRPSTDLYNRTDPRIRDAMSPLLVGEAEDTERGVQALQPALRRVVEVCHLERGPKALKARMCGCRQKTMFERLTMAKAALVSWLQEYQRRMRNLGGGAAERFHI